MKQFLFLAALLAMGTPRMLAADANTVEIAYSGTTATVTIADNIASYVTASANGAHVTITQTNTADVDGAEITYILSGTSTNGEFYLNGSYKCTVSLNGLTLTNPSGAAISIINGKRIKVKAETNTENTLVDGSGSQKGCLYVKGHLELRGYGTLNVTGNFAHGIKSGEYMSVKNLTVNVKSAVKDGMNCNEYFLMESGTVNITNAAGDGIQCDIDNTAGTSIAASDDQHTDEDTGNVYMTGGTLNIALASTSTGKLIKAAGEISMTGGTYNGVTGIETVPVSTTATSAPSAIYDLSGRQYADGSALPHGVYIIHNNGKTYKVNVK
ncbi:MAG: carbohydrate-binding domain-containing protein [Prevotella sp.]|nr:carbohydrate-binding domain-containing protein [Prevotella sp.]